MSTPRRAAVLGIALVAALSVLVFSSFASSGSTPRRPTTLVAARIPIAAFAQEGPRVAWVEQDGELCGGDGSRYTVRVRSLSDRVTRSIRPPFNNCVKEMALAGNRALWLVRSCGHSCYQHVSLWAPRRPRSYDVTYGSHDGAGAIFDGVTDDGEHVGRLVGSEGLLLYASVSRGHAPPSCSAGDPDFLPLGCSSDVTGGRLVRIDGLRKARAVGSALAAVALSTEGRRIALLRSQPRDSGSKADPEWSPDGTKIAFTSGFGSLASAVYVADLANSQLTPVVQDGLAGGPAWRPDGLALAFHTDGGVRVFEDGRSKRLASGYQPSWSHDGRRLAFIDGYGDLRTVVVPGAAAKRLTKNGRAREPAWSPDGSRIAFAAATDRGRDEIWTVASDGNGARRVTPGASPAWSPNGARIAFSRGDSVFTTTPDGRDERRVTRGRDPSWAPDGRRLAFVRGRGAAGDVYTSNVEGSDVRRVTDLRPAARRQVGEIRSAGGGVLAEFRPAAKARAVGLSRSVLAVLVGGPRVAIELRDPRSGALRQVIRVPRRTDAELGVSGSRIVFRVGRTIHALDARTIRQSVIARAQTTPIGLSIEGNRVAWAENVGGRGRVRAVFLSGSR